ncbi:low molecular weight protein-tyrosine-phosphatase [Teredinibacter franksiae]|jgi:protein tyrosine phosphatase|uniref:low molecular weight protein-tyrosine-phosphatase n=1 Tax=Teredinibacter franksiae TaxID=2761453 RepID=UPI00162427EC|nr:low molecular weight protein-tyrosine-phosphatase [Teredinibacter franksiae]
MQETRVLFVCLGNICRSPTAHGIFQAYVDRENLSHVIRIESAGTSGWHVGDPPDSRAMAAAKSRGFDLSRLRGRGFTASDFLAFDYILAMDNDNLSAMQALQPSTYTGHLSLFLDFSQQTAYREVPDPYYGAADGFSTVLDLVEDGCAGLLEHIRQTRS